MKAITVAWRVSKPWMRVTAVALIVIAAVMLLRLAGNAFNRQTGLDAVMSPPAATYVGPTAASYSSPSEPVKDDHFDAKLMCRQFVGNSLKAPATARFSPFNETAAAPANDKKFKDIPNSWDSTGYVDAQNSFGALIRNEYFCTMQRTGPDKWRLLDLAVWVKSGP